VSQLPLWISAAATCGIFFAAAIQLHLIRRQIGLGAEENRQRSTVTACERFDTDPVIHQITKRIWTASAGGQHYDPDHIDTHDLIALLNYFDALAIGVEQGFYDEAVVKAHMSLSSRMPSQPSSSPNRQSGLSRPKGTKPSFASIRRGAVIRTKLNKRGCRLPTRLRVRNTSRLTLAPKRLQSRVWTGVPGGRCHGRS
jgi:hypothetical protein